MKNAGIFYGHLVYLFYGQLVYYTAIWYISRPFSIVCVLFGYISPVLVCRTKKNLASPVGCDAAWANISATQLKNFSAQDLWLPLIPSLLTRKQGDHIVRIFAIGDWFLWEDYWKLCNFIQFKGYFLIEKKVCIYFDKKELGHILGDLIKNSSGHPALKPLADGGPGWNWCLDWKTLCLNTLPKNWIARVNSIIES
jgi:hypothetical protein